MSVLNGFVAGIKDGNIWVKVPCKNADNFLQDRTESVLVDFADGRKITTAQRKKIYALLHAICIWSGYTPLEAEKAMTKQSFLTLQTPTLAQTFSLSNCSVEIARKYITYLIDFMLTHGVASDEPLWKLCEDIPRYIYMAALHKRCVVCGRKAELHHALGGTVGAGNNRRTVNHLGRPCLPLCWEHHTEAHKIGHENFCNKYHLEPVKIDEKIGKIYGLFIEENIDKNEEGL